MKKISEISFAIAERVTLLVGAIGFSMMVWAEHLDHGRELDLAKMLFEFGMVLGPIGIVGAIYEFTLRREFEKSRQDLARKSSAIVLVMPEERLTKLRELIGGAKQELIMLGNATLYDFYRSEEWLHDAFVHLRSVKVACLAERSEYVRTRDVQSDHKSNLVQELQINTTVVRMMRSWNPRNAKRFWGLLPAREERLDIFDYDVPPSIWFAICDQKTILGSWYPYGSADTAPCIYVEDARQTPETRALLRHYLHAFEFIEKKRDAQRAIPPQ